MITTNYINPTNINSPTIVTTRTGSITTTVTNDPSIPTTNAALNTPTITECKDISEKIALSETLGLYIKPIARLNVTIHLPVTKLPGQIASPAEIIENLRKQSFPLDLVTVKVIKNTLDFLRFEIEIENKIGIKSLLTKLDGGAIKLSTYTELVKIRAGEAKIAYPTRHEWDTFYQSTALTFNDLKPSERPDTIHVQDLPIRWFADRKGDPNRPSETVLREVFGLFGEIRSMDVPIMERLGSKYNFEKFDSNTRTFDVYVQYQDYISFVKAMDTFRGMKLLYIDRESRSAFTNNFRVDFDRTRYFSDKEVQKRGIEKLKTIEMDKIKYSQFEKERERAAKTKEIANYKAQLQNAEEGLKSNDTKSKEERRREREETRRQKRLAEKQHEEEKKLSLKIAKEERKILIAQRKLESMRLLEELFNRVKEILTEDELKKYTIPPKEVKQVEVAAPVVIEEVKKEEKAENEEMIEKVVEVEEKEKDRKKSKEKSRNETTMSSGRDKRSSIDKKKKKDDDDRDSNDSGKGTPPPPREHKRSSSKKSKKQQQQTPSSDNELEQRRNVDEPSRKSKKDKKRQDKSDESYDSDRRSPEAAATATTSSRKSKKDKKRYENRMDEHAQYTRDRMMYNMKMDQQMRYEHVIQQRDRCLPPHTSSSSKLRSSVHVKAYDSDQDNNNKREWNSRSRSRSSSSQTRSRSRTRSSRSPQSIRSP